MEWQGVILDLDGTLLDSMGIWDDAGARYLRGRQKEPVPDLNAVLAPMSMGEAAVFVKKTYGLWEEPGEIVEGVRRIVWEDYARNVPAKDGAGEFLRRLKKHRIPAVVATASDRDCAVAALERLGLISCILGIVTCQEAKVGKTNALVYELARARLGTETAFTCVFEDALHAVRTAKAAGYPVVAMYDRCHARDEREIRGTADYYVRDFWEAAELF